MAPKKPKKPASKKAAKKPKAKAKPAAKASAKKKGPGQPRKTKGTTRRRGSGKRKGDGDSKGIPKGSRGLNNAQKSLRDSFILQRRSQGWTWEEISGEIELSITQCKRAAKAKRETMLQILDMDPIAVVKKIIDGFEASIGDLEKMAVEYAAHHPSAAVGAKKGADEARRNLIQLLQSIGFLPQELGTIRWVVEVRQIVELITQSVARFETRIGELELPENTRKQLEEEAGELRGALEQAAGNGSSA